MPLPKVTPISLEDAREIVRHTLADPANREVIDRFHRLFYDLSHTWRALSWMGAACLKNPFDLMVYQDLIWNIKPHLIIETGTGLGGTTLFLANMMDIVGHGCVFTVDVEKAPEVPVHQRIYRWIGDSCGKETLDAVHELRRQIEGPVMVILDSDHTAGHVYRELQNYSPLVTVGSYLIVEDSNVNGHPARVKHGPGPFEAIWRFLAKNPNFMPDPICERLLVTFNPSGYLLRTE